MAAAHPGAVIVRTSLIYGGEVLSGHERRILDVADGRADLAFFTDELRCPVQRRRSGAGAARAGADCRPPGRCTWPVPTASAATSSPAWWPRPTAVRAITCARRRAPRRRRDRPRDCRLDCSRAAALGGPLPGVRAVLGCSGDRQPASMVQKFKRPR